MIDADCRVFIWKIIQFMCNLFTQGKSHVYVIISDSFDWGLYCDADRIFRHVIRKWTVSSMCVNYLKPSMKAFSILNADLTCTNACSVTNAHANACAESGASNSRTSWRTRKGTRTRILALIVARKGLWDIRSYYSKLSNIVRY